MKNRRSKQNTLSVKNVVIASAIGLCAVGIAVGAAFSSTRSRLPVSGGVSSVAQDDGSKPAEAVNVPANNVPKDKPSTTTTAKPPHSSAAEEVNKPVVADIGNIMPVSGEVSHPFSNGELVKSETLGVWKTHDGCDILCPLGTPVLSMSQGVVKEITDDPLWGVMVVVEQTNGLDVYYCGLAKELEIKAGREVKQGDIIGKTGDTCRCETSQEPHLHLGVKESGKWVDPIGVVSA